MGILGRLLLICLVLFTWFIVADAIIDAPREQVESISRRDKAKHYVQQGNALLEQGKLGNAWEAYTRAIHLDYHYGVPWLQRGRVRLKQDRFIEARRQLIFAGLKDLNDRDRAESFYLDAQCLKQLKDGSGAMLSVQACLSLDSSHQAAQNLRLELQSNSGS